MRKTLKLTLLFILTIAAIFSTSGCTDDNMDNIEIILTDLSEGTTKRLAEKHNPHGLEQNKEVARMGGHAAKVAREDIERNLGESVVTKQNRLNYEYKETKELEVSRK